MNTDAEKILVDSRGASGVKTSRGLVSARTVLANVSPQALYTKLLRRPPVGLAEAAARYQNGRGAMQIHLALSSPVQWLDSRLDSVPLIHLSNGSDGTGIACAQAEAGLLPTEPTVVVGQQCVLDPSRAPAGKASLWLQLQEVPFALAGDAAGMLSAQGG